MLKTRVIPVLLLKGNSVVKTVNYQDPRMVGDAITNVKVFSSRLADEMVIVDIEATKLGRINVSQITRLARVCVMPLTIGGGVDSLAKADQIFDCGADKVVLCSAFYQTPDLLSDIARKYGSQAVVFSLDVRLIEGRYVASYDSSSKLSSFSAASAARLAVERGAGEILLNSVDRDGMMTGYDLNLVTEISALVQVPVIASGGCGSKAHCVEAIDAGASAVAAGSIFYWVGESVLSLKAHMSSRSIEVREV